MGRPLYDSKSRNHKILINLKIKNYYKEKTNNNNMSKAEIKITNQGKNI